jgi:hypothetical protein
MHFVNILRGGLKGLDTNLEICYYFIKISDI